MSNNISSKFDLNKSLDRNRNSRLNKDFMSHGFVTENTIAERTRRFFRIPYRDTHNVLQGAKEYLFFTKPNLFLFNPDASVTTSIAGKVSVKDLHPSIQRNSPTLCSLYMEVPYLFHELSRKHNLNQSYCGNFIPLLTNTVRGSLDLPGIEADYIELNKTSTGATRSIRQSSFSSDNSFDFSLEFSDNKFLEIYKLSKIYDEYFRLKNSGLLDILVDPTSTTSDLNQEMFDSLIKNIDTEVFSIYRFLVASNGEDIIHYSKLVGVSMTNVPRDSLSADTASDGNTSTPISFKADHVIDSDPMILIDFNKVGGVYTIGKSIIPPYAKLWDKDRFDINSMPVGTPFVLEKDEQGRRFGGNYERKATYFKLKFLDLERSII